MVGSFSEDEALQPGMPSPGSVLDIGGDSYGDSPHAGHNMLRKDQSDADSLKNRKKFGKRQSKSGLAAVF